MSNPAEACHHVVVRSKHWTIALADIRLAQQCASFEFYLAYLTALQLR
jgi:hypothetical protein